MSWLQPESYNDPDLARTVGNLDGFFNQILSADGRGKTPTEPPHAVVSAVSDALRELDLDESGAFELQCRRLSLGFRKAKWRPVAEQVLASCFATWDSIADRLRADRSSSDEGTVSGLFVSGGGVPKTAVDSAVVGVRGIEGDRQRTRVHHGRPWQALCIWSAETVAKLQAEGHPIAPGCAGENISLRGVDFASVVPGTRLRIGAMTADVTIMALPCAANARWFRDGNFSRMHHLVEPGVSRLYAAVIEPGTVMVGDSFSVELR